MSILTLKVHSHVLVLALFLFETFKFYIIKHSCEYLQNEYFTSYSEQYKLTLFRINDILKL